MSAPPGLQVILPTRNRAAMAARTIASVLDTADGAVRVLVSDNSSDKPERDALCAWIAARADAGVVYLSPPQPLPLALHWDWAIEQALAISDNDHLTLVTDRVVFKRNGLRQVMEIARGIPDKVLSYSNDMIYDHAQPVRFQAQPHTGRLVEVATARLLALTAHGTIHPALPRLLNCIVPRRLFERLSARYGNYVRSLSPDCSFCYRLLEMIDSLLYWDEAPWVTYGLGVSNSYTQLRGYPTKASTEFFSVIESNALQGTVPAPELSTPLNVHLHEYALVRQSTGNPKFPPLEVADYLQLLERELDMMENPAQRKESWLRLNAARARWRTANGASSWRERIEKRVAWEVWAPWSRPLRELAHRLVRLKARERAFEFPSGAQAVEFAQEYSPPRVSDSAQLRLVI